MKHVVTRAVGFLFMLAFVLTEIPFMEAQAAAKPVIKCSEHAVLKNSFMIGKGDTEQLIAKSGKKNVTKKGTWKSSKKSVAAVSKKGLLTAKKAGITYVTVKYKGKTSKKMKVIVIDMTAGQQGPSDPGTEPESPSVQGTYTIKYNVNSKNKSDKLSGSSTQYVSGEILNFDTTVQADSSHKFLGWYDAPTGGKHIYESYRPTKNMTLYAHYTDKKVRKVDFVLGCKYGDTYSFMSGRSKWTTHYRDFDWLKQEDLSGPMVDGEEDNVSWYHTFTLNEEKDSYFVDDLPVPSIPGYTFVGWYTTQQGRNVSVALDGDRIDPNSNVSSDIANLYARFTKKLTISFDDLRGGKYDDIVVDSYKSIAECGQELPRPEIPGATFLGWTMDTDNHDMAWSTPIITKDTAFLNCINWCGFMCSGCGAVSKHMQDCVVYDEPGCDVSFSAVNDDYHVFEETDHFTLYPAYEFHRVNISFDPKGGYFPYDSYKENSQLYFDGVKYDVNHSYKSIGVYPSGIGSEPYGDGIFPGHESDPGSDRGCWYYGNGRKTMPKIRRDHYIFDKWAYLDKDGNEQEFTFDTILTENMTVYAKWTLGKCMVLYDATDGVVTQAERDRVGLLPGPYYTIVTESTVAKDGKVMPVPVSSEGRKFEGWYTSDGKPFDENTPVTGDTTLFAHWGKLQKELPVTLKFDANGGMFKNASDATKITANGEAFGQLPDLEDYPEHDFLGWYIVKANMSSPYDDSSFLQKATKTTRVTSAMVNAGNEVLIVAKWGNVEHVADIYINTLDDRGLATVDKDNNHYSIAHKGKGVDTGLEFVAMVSPKTVPDSLKNIRWTSSDPNIVYIDGNDITKGGEWIDWFKFGDNLGDATITATSIDNPNISFDIYVTVKEK